MSTISSSTTTTTGFVVTSNTTGTLVLQTGSTPTTAVTIDASQNMGLGVTPSAWSLIKAFQLPSGVHLGSYTGSSTPNLYLGANNYFNGTNFIYSGTYAATKYEQTAGTHAWYYAASGTAGNAITFTQAMTLDASGNLLVGDTTADYSQSGRGVIEVNGSSTSLMALKAGGNPQSYWYYDGANVDFYAVNGALRFGTAGTERARIDSSGNLLVGTTNSNPIGSNVAGSVTSPAGNLSISRDAAPSLDLNRYTSDGTVARFYRSATQVGRIDVTTTATSYVTSSDYRLKENPQPMQNALATVAQLKPCTYTWKVNGQQGQGFIAHELQAVIPDAVSGEKDAVDENGDAVYQGIDTSFLVATLTAAIQEQQAIIDAQLAALETLTNRISALENK